MRGGRCTFFTFEPEQRARHAGFGQVLPTLVFPSREKDARIVTFEGDPVC